MVGWMLISTRPQRRLRNTGPMSQRTSVEDSFLFLILFTVWLLTAWHMGDIIESSEYKGLH